MRVGFHKMSNFRFRLIRHNNNHLKIETYDVYDVLKRLFHLLILFDVPVKLQTADDLQTTI